VRAPQGCDVHGLGRQRQAQRDRAPEPEQRDPHRAQLRTRDRASQLRNASRPVDTGNDSDQRSATSSTTGAERGELLLHRGSKGSGLGRLDRPRQIDRHDVLGKGHVIDHAVARGSCGDRAPRDLLERQLRIHALKHEGERRCPRPRRSGVGERRGDPEITLREFSAHNRLGPQPPGQVDEICPTGCPRTERRDIDRLVPKSLRKRELRSTDNRAGSPAEQLRAREGQSRLRCQSQRGRGGTANGMQWIRAPTATCERRQRQRCRENREGKLPVLQAGRSLTVDPGCPGLAWRIRGTAFPAETVRIRRTPRLSG
jgi:hypothetical protein